MTFVSDLRGYTIIGANNASKYVAQARPAGGAFGSGFVQRDYVKNPAGFYAPLSSIPKIPRSEWTERIEEIEKKKTGLADLHRALNVPVLNQKQTNYCWCFGTTKAVMMAYARLTNKVPFLSATSVAAKITGYENRGSWAGEALEGFEKFGCSTVDFWPEGDINRKYDTEEQRKNASFHKTGKWEELPSRDFDAIMSALLLGFPVTLGLTWWSHLVCGLQPRVLGRNEFGVEFVNSWSPDWEKGGFSVLNEEKATAYEAIVMKSAKPATLAS